MGWLDKGQAFLDGLSIALDLSVVGATVSWAPDLANACISTGRGNYGDAMLSVGAMVPVVGIVGNGARLARFTHRHHGLPVQWALEFAARGIKNIHEFGRELPVALHKAIHRAGWNKEWGTWLRANPDAGEDAIKSQLRTMEVGYGIDGYPQCTARRR